MYHLHIDLVPVNMQLRTLAPPHGQIYLPIDLFAAHPWYVCSDSNLSQSSKIKQVLQYNWGKVIHLLEKKLIYALWVSIYYCGKNQTWSQHNWLEQKFTLFIHVHTRALVKQLDRMPITEVSTTSLLPARHLVHLRDQYIAFDWVSIEG
jgi:hypothetical protein